jgi:hypothetical protein
VMGAWSHRVKPIRPPRIIKIIYPEDVVLRLPRSTGCWRSRQQEE